MRLFIAVEPPDEIKENIEKVKKVVPQISPIKWVEKQNIHITLKFLGEVEEKKVISIDEKLNKLMNKFKTFEISLQKIDFFPNSKSPRVIWIGIEKGKSELTDISQNIEKELSEIGIKKEERPFSAHLTIARVKDKISNEFINLLLNLKDVNFGSFNAESIKLIHSILKPTGPVYTTIKTYKLRC